MSTTEPQFNDPPRPFGQYPVRLKANVGKLVRAQPSVLGYSLEGNLKPTVTFLGTVVGACALLL